MAAPLWSTCSLLEKAFFSESVIRFSIAEIFAFKDEWILKEPRVCERDAHFLPVIVVNLSPLIIDKKPHKSGIRYHGFRTITLLRPQSMFSIDVVKQMKLLPQQEILSGKCIHVWNYSSGPDDNCNFRENWLDLEFIQRPSFFFQPNSDDSLTLPRSLYSIYIYIQARSFRRFITLHSIFRLVYLRFTVLSTQDCITCPFLKYFSRRCVSTVHLWFKSAGRDVAIDT